MAYDILIVGAGITGATLAQVLTERGKKCLVVERRDEIGGNCRDEMREGILVHNYGPHIFHTSNPELWNYVNRFTTFNHFINAPVANYKGTIYNLPFNMNTFSKLWGVTTPQEAKEELEHQRVKYNHEPRNLEEQALSLTGRDIYEKLIRGYTEKQWGRQCSELPASILERIPFRYVYNNNYYNDAYQGIPTDGYTDMLRCMLNGVEVRCCVDYLADRKTLDHLASRTVYTGMIDAFFQYSEGVLQYRTLRFESEALKMQNYQGVAVVNYTDAETPFTRIIEHKHFAFGTQPNTIITREFPAEWHFGAEPFYPVNDERNTTLYEEYRKMAERERDVSFCGRLAEYHYRDMATAIEKALLLAKRL